MTSLGYRAYTRDEFIAQIARFYKYETGLGTNIMLMTIISFIIGLSISARRSMRSSSKTSTSSAR